MPPRAWTACSPEFCGAVQGRQLELWRALKGTKCCTRPLRSHTNTKATMSGLMAKTLHPACALVGYTIITAIVFGGLLSSNFDMFVAVGVPTCMAGTTSNPYPLSSQGVPTANGPNAPDANSVPFCTSDALLSSYVISFNAYGYVGIAKGGFDTFYAVNAVETSPFCLKKSNGTCPTFGAQGANIVTVKAVTGSTFMVTDANMFTQAGGGESFANYNNFPITLGPSGANLPVADGSKTYYMRNFQTSKLGSVTFSIASDTTSGPLTFTSTPTNPITVTFTALSNCGSQQNVAPADGSNPANINADGTLKTGTCGYCLTQPQQIGVLAVPGLCGVTLALLLIMELMMCMPFIRKKGFFRILVIVFSVLCMIFLIAAVAGAAVTFSQVAQCFSQNDFSQAQLMPSPTGAPAISGYTPSSGGATLFPAGFKNGKFAVPGLYSAVQASGSAAYVKPYLVPSAGAAQLIIAIVLLFLFTIFFAIKTDWTAVAASADSGSSAIMTPM